MKKAFTLIEVVIVITIIGILYAIVLTAINPGLRLSQARDAKRGGGVFSIYAAVKQYQLDQAGIYPTEIDSDPDTYQVLGTDTSGCDTTCTVVETKSACLDLTGLLVDRYLVEMPFDPNTGSLENTDYAINLADDKISVVACDPETRESLKAGR